MTNTHVCTFIIRLGYGREGYAYTYKECYIAIYIAQLLQDTSVTSTSIKTQIATGDKYDVLLKCSRMATEWPLSATILYSILCAIATVPILYTKRKPTRTIYDRGVNSKLL